MSALPVDVAAGVHQVAEQLHKLLHDEMVREHPTAEARLLWQAAKLLNTAVGALDYSTLDRLDPGQQRTAQWVDAAEIASDIADEALGIAAAAITLPDAARQIERTDVDLVDLGLDQAAAFGGTITVTTNPGHLDDERTITVAIADDPGRTLTVTDPGHPAGAEAGHTASTLLRTAHHLHRLGAVLGEAVDATDRT
ncbi:hypothetical protein ACFFX1_10920 [Dactylosporangium sucinum]|uniref:Uncharacterized protein n=1 Tax=Dactylosporangium sucinum TaxID=1424081 RepID=A0A917TGM5_9ACTN|nr:hypothetical protein [Dactylosporangium sucinum]GGM22776.1 hypothetical protein GCM10007977_024960 [Dactylosporangium sucinum]